MLQFRKTSFVCAALLTICSLLQAQSAATSAHLFFEVVAPASAPAPLNGRLLIFLKEGTGDKEVDSTEFKPSATPTWIAAREVHDWQPGTPFEVDTDATAFPKGFSALPAGSYEVQAILDVDHSYNYSGRGPQDWASPVVPVVNPASSAAAKESVLTLDHHPGEDPDRAAAMAKIYAAATPDVAHLEEFESPLMSRFWGHPVHIKAWIILPPGYGSHNQETYPTVYWTSGFGGNLESALAFGIRVVHERMVSGKMPPMIWVMLDHSIPQGTHEFADSVNNGPWGTALTTEFIPYLENKYHMDAKATGRLLNGHSSGGWATLQLQVNYPKIFGGTWSTSPDPSDFHDFTGPDLYAPNANLYRKPDGTAVPIFREKGKVVATMEQFAHLEEVLGPYGGQLASFDWVFSPRSPSGAPEPMFDRETGKVDPVVVAYWHDHYDLAHLVASDWSLRGPDLKGRIHLYVGTADTFYLDGAAHRFEAVLARLGADAHFTYIPDRTHFDLYKVGEDRSGLFDEITSQMYSVARPGIVWKKQ